MAICVKESTEPLGGAGGRRQDGPWLESGAVDSLIREMRRYLREDIRGRSLLVAGHRGAGKTSAVHKAIEDLIHDPDCQNKRPLLVRIYGPDLLTVSNSHALTCPLSKPAAVRTESPALQCNCNEEQFALHARRQIVLALLRALCDEMANRYEKRALGSEHGKSPRANQERNEQAAQFRMELDLEPDEIRLREYWEHVQGLPDGILCDSLSENRPKDPSDIQGFREIVALATLLRVHREIKRHRKLEDDRRKGRTADQDEVRPVESQPFLHELLKLFSKSGHLLNPLAGIAVGIALVTILVKNDVDLFLSLAAGVLGAILATFLLNFATTRDQQSTLIASSDSSSLNLTLPVLLERVRAARLHPIFIVDELDKVKEDLPGLMTRLMNSLKHIVADQAFFCFLVNREYFEQTAIERRDNPYPAAETYFGDLIFVHHTPVQLHKYLNELLEFSRSTALTPEDIETKALLIYITLYGSKMHVGRLRRYINSNSKSNSEIDIKRPELKEVLSYQYQVLIQVAVELILSEDDLQMRLRQAPDNTMQVYDALYYPARQWDQEKLTLRTGVEDFGSYLKLRTESKDTRYTEPDVRLLREQMLNVVRLLEQPEELSKIIFFALIKSEPFAAWRPADGPVEPTGNDNYKTLRKTLIDKLKGQVGDGTPQPLRTLVTKLPGAEPTAEFLALCDAIEAFDTYDKWSPLVKRDPADVDIFRWSVDRYGRELGDVVYKQRQTDIILSTQKAIISIQSLDRMMRDATGNKYGLQDLDTPLHLLPQMKPWQELQQRINDFARRRDGSPDLYKDHIMQYMGEIERFGDVLRSGIRLAWFFGKLEASNSGVAFPLVRGLESEAFKKMDLSTKTTAGKRLAVMQEEWERIESQADNRAAVLMSPLQRLAEERVLRGTGSEVDDWLPALQAFLMDDAG